MKLIKMYVRRRAVNYKPSIGKHRKNLNRQLPEHKIFKGQDFLKLEIEGLSVGFVRGFVSAFFLSKI